MIILESCPPISIIVLTSGLTFKDATAWDVISFLTSSAPKIIDARCLPLPVVPTPCILFSPNLFATSSIPTFIISIGFPCVLRYFLYISSFFSSINTIFVLTEPTSIPR